MLRMVESTSTVVHRRWRTSSFVLAWKLTYAAGNCCCCTLWVLLRPCASPKQKYCNASRVHRTSCVHNQHTKAHAVNEIDISSDQITKDTNTNTNTGRRWLHETRSCPALATLNRTDSMTVEENKEHAPPERELEPSTPARHMSGSISTYSSRKGIKGAARSRSKQSRSLSTWQATRNRRVSYRRRGPAFSPQHRTDSTSCNLWSSVEC